MGTAGRCSETLPACALFSSWGGNAKPGYMLHESLAQFYTRSCSSQHDALPAGRPDAGEVASLTQPTAGFPGPWCLSATLGRHVCVLCSSTAAGAQTPSRLLAVSMLIEGASRQCGFAGALSSVRCPLLTRALALASQRCSQRMPAGQQVSLTHDCQRRPRCHDGLAQLHRWALCAYRVSRSWSA